MINFIKKLIFFNFVCILCTPLFAFSSSSFLISQFAFKNHDYESTIYNFTNYDDKYSQNILLDNLIAAVITENLSLANKIADEILKEDSQNQESNIVKIIYLIINDKLDELNKIYNKSYEKNDLINFIFFNNQKLLNNESISNSLVDIVVSSYSKSDTMSLNYNFLFFYISLGNLIDPKNDRAKLIKGELFQNVERANMARKIFETIDKNSSYYIEAQKSLAYNYSSFLSFDKAEEKIKKLLLNTNNNYFIKKILADFYRYKKKYNLAIVEYDQMINSNREDLWDVYYMRGICYERLGQWDKAEKDFLKSLDLKSDSANVLNYLAYGWVEREIKLDQSLKMLEAAYKANPESYYIIDSLAWAHFKRNNLEEAARLMEIVIDMAPGEVISLDHLGDIYYALNRKREAIHFWRQALELAEPEDEIEEDVQSKLNKFNAG